MSRNPISEISGWTIHATGDPLYSWEVLYEGKPLRDWGCLFNERFMYHEHAEAWLSTYGDAWQARIERRSKKEAA